MPAKASAGTEVIPLLERSSLPPCVGQEPDRTSGAPSELPLKVHSPNPTVQGHAEALLDAARRPSSASKLCLDHEVPTQPISMSGSVLCLQCKITLSPTGERDIINILGRESTIGDTIS
jgi:hypothetical protein